MGLRLVKLRSILVVLAMVVVEARCALHNVTIPGKMVFVPGASAYRLGIGEVESDSANASFSFDTPPRQSILLYTFRHFNLPSASFNTFSFCASFTCNLMNNQGTSIGDITSSCEDNGNHNLFGPIVNVPDATNVTCSVTWYYHGDKSDLTGSVEILFASAYNGDCAGAYPDLNNSAWCDVNLDGLVDASYEKSNLTLCLEKNVARTVFNATCLESADRSLPRLSRFNLVVIVSSLAVFLVVLASAICFIVKLVKRPKSQKPVVPSGLASTKLLAGQPEGSDNHQEEQDEESEPSHGITDNDEITKPLK